MVEVPSACTLARLGISVSTHGRLKIKGKITRPGRVSIRNQKCCVNKLVRRVWLTEPHKTDLRYELWSSVW